MSLSQLSSENLLDIISNKKLNNNRGLSYSGAVDSGLNPKIYTYTDLPTGKVTARLDFKIWNKSSGLSLHFTQLPSNKPFRISVFTDMNSKSQGYMDRSGTIDFSEVNINGVIYELDINQTKSGNFSIKSARIVMDIRKI